MAGKKLPHKQGLERAKRIWHDIQVLFKPEEYETMGQKDGRAIDIAKRHGVHVATVIDIAKGRSWSKEVTGLPNARLRANESMRRMSAKGTIPYNKLEPMQRRAIMVLADNRFSQYEISYITHVSRETVRRVFEEESEARERLAQPFGQPEQAPIEYPVDTQPVVRIPEGYQPQRPAPSIYANDWSLEYEDQQTALADMYKELRQMRGILAQILNGGRMRGGK